MAKNSLTLLVSALAVCAALYSAPAKADYVMWQDAQLGVSLSYPDTWHTVNNEQPNDVITVALPSGDDKAVCRLRADDEGRFLIYPSKLQGNVQKTNFAGEAFWKEYLAIYEQPQIHTMNDAAGLGRSFASMVVASYLQAPDKPYAFRTGIAAVSPYYDHVYVAECSADAKNYNAYHDLFLSFMKSIDYKKAYHELTIGNYPRDFITPRSTIEVPLKNAVSTTTY